MKLFCVTAMILCTTVKIHAQHFITDNVVAGKTGSHWQGYKSNGPATTWGFQQNDVMYIGIGGDLYNKGFSANAMGIFNGSLTKEDVFLFNQNSGSADFLVLKNTGNVGIGTTNPNSRLHVKSGSIELSDILYNNINVKMTMNDQVPLMRFTRWTGVADHQHNAFVGQFYNNIRDEYSLGFGTGTTTDGNQETATTKMAITNNGNVGIGVINPQEKLVVAGNIHAQKVKVTVSTGADFVFEPDYRLKSLEEIREFIQKHKHLPEIPSAKEMETNGIELAEMNIKLLQKVEELTLHLIEQQKQIEELKKEVLSQKEKK